MTTSPTSPSRREQGSFLVGVAAGLKTKTDKVGFVGGVKGPIIDPFAAGYQAGVKAVNPKATVEMKWLSDQADAKAFANPPGGKTAATALYDNGSDIVFHASGLSGNGVFEAAAAEDKLAIGVDSDQYLTAPTDQQSHILTSALKRVDVAVFDFAKAFDDGDDQVRLRRLRPQARRCRLRHQRRPDRRHQGPDRLLQGEDHLGRGQGAQHPLIGPRTHRTITGPRARTGTR